jgi:hypothetical protein
VSNSKGLNLLLQTRCILNIIKNFVTKHIKLNTFLKMKLGFEFSASHFLGRCSSTWATPLVHLSPVFFSSPQEWVQELRRTWAFAGLRRKRVACGPRER